jgi:hypothetical protein
MGEKTYGEEVLWEQLFEIPFFSHGLEKGIFA